MPAYENLDRLGIKLPVPTPPVAAFQLWVQSGNLLFVSGHIAKRDGVPWAGQLGLELTVSEGQEAARLVAIDLLGTLHAATGDLNRIRIVKLLVLVNSTSEFFQQHLVANGASEFLVEILGEQGKHARSAFGAAQIPFGSCVEIELIAELS
ncbi:MAG TPA: RidA family protein [Thermoanaerobaculia bacterium]|nr:RidA family protein [Thermoanaerobaculia bacterium]